MYFTCVIASPTFRHRKHNMNRERDCISYPFQLRISSHSKCPINPTYTLW